MKIFNIPIQPAGADIISNSATAAQWYGLWDTLGLTKTLLGNGAGDLPVYKYVHVVGSNCRNIVITTLVHGTEIVAPKQVFQAAKLLLESNIREIVYLRSVANITFIPVVNPSGRNLNTYNNANNVNINRNAGTEAEWTASVDANKGAGWKSEPETQLIDALLNSLKPVVFIDMHNTNAILNYGYSYACRNTEYAVKTMLESVCLALKPTVNVDDQSSTSPMLMNMAAGIYKTTGATIDYVPSGTGETAQSAGDITVGTEMVLNFMYNMLVFNGTGTSNLPLPAGTQRALRLRQNNSYIPSNIAGASVFKFGALTDAKYNSFKALLSDANKMIVVNGLSGAKIKKFHDGTDKALWLNYTLAQDTQLLLCAGSGISDVNDSTVFTNHIISSGLNDAFGDAVNRVGGVLTAANIETYGVDGSLDKCMRFNGNNSNLSLANAGTLFTGQKKISLVFRLSQDVLAATDRIFRCLNGSNFIQISTNNTLGLIIYLGTASSYAYTAYSSLVTAGEMFTLAVVIDTDLAQASKVKIYINGVLASSSTGGTFPSAIPDLGTAPAVIGYGDTSFDGLIDEANILVGKALSADEVKLLHNQFASTDFMSTTIQPVINKVVKSGTNYTITGTGFKPATDTPVVFVNGVAATITDDTDTSIAVAEGVGTPEGEKFITITNSDGETAWTIPKSPSRRSGLGGFKSAFNRAFR